MSKRFHVTYEIVTPESAEHGDFAEAGFVLPGGWKEELKPDVYGKEAGKVRGQCALTLREAADLFSGYACEDSGHWFSEADARQNYRTGAEERRSLHPPRNITAASYARLRRLLSAH